MDGTPPRLRPAFRAALALLIYGAMGALSGCGSGPRSEAEGANLGEDRASERLTTSPPSSVAASGADPLFSDLEDFTGLPPEPRRNASGGFWDHWGDGRAELSGYRVTLDRYGEPRVAQLSLIYVTEPHDRRTWIKDDRAEAPNRVEVLKLIRSMQFMTGIYPYFVMGSTFAPVDSWGNERFQPVRINLDVQEWCGSVSQRVFPGRDGVRSVRLSYFEDEGETRRQMDLGEGTLYEDALLIQLRELDGPFHESEDWEGQMVRELWSLRTGHAAIQPVRARITRSEETREGVPVTRFRLEAGEYWRTYDVERAEPRRVLGWKTSTGESAEILRTERLSYWQLNQPGDERYRESLGLGLQ